MNYRELLKQQSGLSLIEIMVAFSILVVAFTGLVQSFPFGLSINKAAENATIASYLAQGKIEELISLGYDNINVGVLEAKQRLSDNPADYLYGYQRQTEVNYVDSNLVDSLDDIGLKKISITIYYTNSISKIEKDYEIATLIVKR
jgi:type II secretory pathway pseudopilin PulG